MTLIEKNTDDNSFCICLFMGLRALGLLRHDLLVNMKENIEKWQQSNGAFYDTCQHLLDVIADRSLAQLDSNINQHKSAIEEIDHKLEDQKDQVKVIDQ